MARQLGGAAFDRRRVRMRPAELEEELCRELLLARHLAPVRGWTSKGRGRKEFCINDVCVSAGALLAHLRP